MSLSENENADTHWAPVLFKIIGLMSVGSSFHWHHRWVENNKSRLSCSQYRLIGKECGSLWCLVTNVTCLCSNSMQLSKITLANLPTYIHTAPYCVLSRLIESNRPNNKHRTVIHMQARHYSSYCSICQNCIGDWLFSPTPPPLLIFHHLSLANRWSEYIITWCNVSAAYAQFVTDVDTRSKVIRQVARPSRRLCTEQERQWTLNYSRKNHY